MHISAISQVLGARITGVDLNEALSQDQFSRLEEALHTHGFIVLPAQSLTPATMVQFARRWGRPEPHVIDTFHHPDDANVLMLSNVYKDGKPVGLVDAGTYFHTDYSYLADAARCTMLYAINVPPGRNGTTFANQALAYAELPQATRERIDNLVVNHHYGNRDDLDTTSRTVASVLNDSQKKKVDWVQHPLVRPHPYTGQKALYAVSGSSFSVEGLKEDEGRALLDELKDHATQDKYCHTYDYTNGDVIVWDNALLLHSAPLIDLTRPRELWRVTLKYTSH
jgi:taurine dioxygenase